MRFQWILTLPALVLFNGAQAQDSDPMIPVELAAVAPNPDGYTFSRTVPGGIVYTHYTNDGNHHDFTLIDAESGRVTEFVANANGPEFVAISDQYFAYRAGQNVAKRIYVIDRKTEQRTESVRLKDAITAGFIDGNRLLAFQGANALVFSLPQLKLEKTLPIPAAVIAVRSPDGFAILGQDLQLLDAELTPLRAITLQRHPARGNFSCGANGLQIAGQRALVMNGCGLVDAYDISTGKLGATIDVGPTLRPMAAIGDLLFVADPPGGAKRRIRVFDLVSGRLLAQREGASNDLVAGRSRLLSLGRSPTLVKTAPVFVYAPNVSAIANDAVSLARVTDSCETPSNGSKSIDELIDECEAAGIQRFTGRADAPAKSQGAIAQYADWLARSNSRFFDAIAVLNQIPQSPRSNELRAVVKKKQEFLGPAADPPDSRPQAPGVRGFPLPSGLTGVAVSDSYLFVSRWDCSGNPTYGVGIDIHDRASLNRVSGVSVADCDEDFQDSVGGFFKVGKYLLFQIDYRYGSDSRPNFGVIDIAHGTLVGKTHLEADLASLSVWNDTVVRCSTGEEATVFDVASMKFSPAPAAAVSACKDGRVTELQESTRSGEERHGLSTAHYDITKGEQSRARVQLQVTRRGGKSSAVMIELPLYNELVAIPDRDSLVVSTEVEGERVVLLVELASGTRSTLFRLREVSQWSGAYAWRNFLFLARGRDLMTYDLDKKVVVDYEKNLIREGLQPVCPACNDGNGIRRLIVEGDRLILQTLSGVHTRAIDLPLYTQRFKGIDFFGK